jgi:integrase
MTEVKLRYLDKVTDRYERDHYYFRRYRRGTRIALPGKPGDPEFIAAYNKALHARVPIGASRHAEGTFAALADKYFASTKFKKLADTTQAVNRGIIERFVAEHGHALVAQMTREHVEHIISERSQTPAAANNLLKKLRMLIGFAIVSGWRETDPTFKIERFKDGEHHTWTDEELAQYEARWPLGTFERTAYAVHLYTGQRRGDVFRMTQADIAGEKVRVVQAKGGSRLVIPFHPKLREALEAWPRKLTLLYSRSGKRYTVESYGNLMAEAIAAAGLPSRCVLHGLRKAAARKLAEAGCTTKEIAAITGHKTLSEVQRYTDAADQEKLAQSAIEKMR